MLVINLLGGPGVGKSTLAAELFVYLKKQGISCEYVTEYAKDKTWENSMMTLNNQIYVFGKQHHKMFRVKDKVDYMIVDSPLLLSIIYGNLGKDSNFYKLIIEEFNRFENINFFMDRKTVYDTTGRYQDEESSITIDNTIKNLLIDADIPFNTYDINQDSVRYIVEKIKEYNNGTNMG